MSKPGLRRWHASMRGGHYGHDVRTEIEAVPCPICSVGAGVRCVTAQGNPSNPHAQRVWNAKGGPRARYP